MEPRSSESQADSLLSDPPGKQYAAAAAAKSLQSCPTLRRHGLQPTGLLRPWEFPGKSAGVGCIAFSREAVYTAQKINEQKPQSQETSRGRSQPGVHSGAQTGRRKTRPSLLSRGAQPVCLLLWLPSQLPLPSVKAFSCPCPVVTSLWFADLHFSVDTE